MSLHATGEAVDMRGNPSCVYAQLRDWPGGYSTDYGRVSTSTSRSPRMVAKRACASHMAVDGIITAIATPAGEVTETSVWFDDAGGSYLPRSLFAEPPTLA